MISVVISAHNEQKHISGCIESCKDLADEIIVVDNSSTDKTSEIAKSLGAKIYTQKNDPFRIDVQKNYGFSKANEEWILSLDADERLTAKGIAEIKKTLENNKGTIGYFIPRKNIIFGKWIRHSLWWPDYQLRLFKKGKGKFNANSVHKPIDVKGEVKHLSEPFLHENYSSISQFVSRMNDIYTEIEAEQFVKSGKRLSPSEALRYPVSDFMKTYFLQKGYRDGLHGLVLSILQAFYMFLVYAKVWEKQGFYEKSDKEVLMAVEKEAEELSREGKFWIFNEKAQATRNPFYKAIYIICKKIVIR